MAEVNEVLGREAPGPSAVAAFGRVDDYRAIVVGAGIVL
eukprot:SAG11_NODE_14681_length_603_cov_1.337302_3_plen_38_part_01